MNEEKREEMDPEILEPREWDRDIAEIALSEAYSRRGPASISITIEIESSGFDGSNQIKEFSFEEEFNPSEYTVERAEAAALAAAMFRMKETLREIGELHKEPGVVWELEYSWRCARLVGDAAGNEEEGEQE